MARDCDLPDTCNKCKQEGHMAKDCSIPDTCRKCKKEGHRAQECELPDVCNKCKEEGHMARDCSLPDTCRRCGAEGHMQADCTEAETTRQYTKMELNELGEEVEKIMEIYIPQPVSDDSLFDDNCPTGINFSSYDEIAVKVDGTDVPPPIVNFSGLRALVQDNIKKSKYTVPTPIQKHGIPIVKANRDLIAVAQTGSGKTAAFLLPIISNLLEKGVETNAGNSVQSPQVLVMTPTRELAKQIYEQSRKFAMGSMIKSVVAYGGMGVVFNIKELERGCNILVATPGRLMDFVEKGKIEFSRLQYFILDEADKMLDMGFGPEIEKCLKNKTMPSAEERNTLMFSATFPSDVQSTARNYMRRDKIFLTIGMIGAPCRDVEQVFLDVKKKEKRKKLLSILEDSARDPDQRIMIFVNTKKNADFLATNLSEAKLPATSIHGDRLQSERESALRDFKNGSKPILVATAVAARGLDIPNVGHVINYEFPTDVDEYVHRVGRTGRVGNRGKATSFIDSELDADLIRPLVRLLSQTGVELPPFMGGGGGDHDEGEAEVGNGGGGDADEEW